MTPGILPCSIKRASVATRLLMSPMGPGFGIIVRAESPSALISRSSFGERCDGISGFLSSAARALATVSIAFLLVPVHAE